MVAVTQLSHLVIDSRISVPSVGQAAFLLVVVWWAWIYSTWMVNWFDPGTPPVRLIVAAVGLISLLMSAAIPRAFDSDAVLFACAYVCMPVGRNTAAMLLDSAAPLRPVFEPLVACSVLSAPLWIAGAFVGGSARVPGHRRAVVAVLRRGCRSVPAPDRRVRRPRPARA